MKIIQKIRIDGKNWNDIINLQCFAGLAKAKDGNGNLEFKVFLYMDSHVNSDIYAEAVMKGPGKVLDTVEKLTDALDIAQMLYGQCEARLGDTLVEYENHKWSVETGR